MMKVLKGVLSVLLAVGPLAATASCESLKADINQKIISNGVPASG
ncbi:DUF1161 domain-containing protein, partial [Erwinia amylovora]|nr:DUF1161 domain-containing protein [Erwinia amylovora]